MSRVTSWGAKARWPTALVLAAVLGTAGCVIIPMPEMNTGHARRNLAKETPQQFKPSRTARAEVMLTLGEPDAVSPDESKLAYRVEKGAGIVILPGAVAALGKDRYFFFQFDENGFLVRCEAYARSYVDDDPSRPTHWQASPAKMGCTNTVGVSSATTNSAARSYFGEWCRFTRELTSEDSLRNGYWPGWLYLTESNLTFVTFAQFANDEPAFALPLSAVAGCWVEKHGYAPSRCLVVRGKEGRTHSFALLKGKYWKEDSEALEAACEFIRSRTKTATR